MTLKLKKSEPGNQDAINPSHYNTGDVECIYAIKSSMCHEKFCGYLKGSIQKYIWRYEKKHADPTECLNKAKWYLEFLIAEEEDHIKSACLDNKS